VTDERSPPAAHVEHPTVRDVFSTILGLKGRDVAVMLAIDGQPGRTTDAIATDLDRDRSNVSRSITRLRDVGLVERRRRVLEDGGIFYEHYPNPTAPTTELLTEAVRRWAERAEHTLTVEFSDE
jgi:predicted transcriptional regulator